MNITLETVLFPMCLLSLSCLLKTRSMLLEVVMMIRIQIPLLLHYLSKWKLFAKKMAPALQRKRNLNTKLVHSQQT